jgi:hypothetical protein
MKNADSLVLYKLKGRLHYLEIERPVLFEVENDLGGFFCGNSIENLIYYKNKGYKTRILNLDIEIESIKKSIIYYEKRGNLQPKLNDLEDQYNTSVRYYRMGAKIPESKFKILEEKIDRLKSKLHFL